MTRISFALCFLSLSVLYSCKEVGDENPIPDGPSITLEVNGTTYQESLNVEVGDVLTLQVTTRTESSMERYLATYNALGESTTWEDLQPDSSVIEYSAEYELYIDYTLSGKEAVVTFSVSDIIGLSDEVTLTLTVGESILKTSENNIVCPFNYLNYGNIYDVEGDTAYFPSNVRSVLTNQNGSDFIFAFDTETKWMIMGLDHPEAVDLWDDNVGFSWPFLNSNATRFKLMNSSEVDFDGLVTSAQLDNFFTDGSTSLSTLAIGQLVAFKLDDQKGGKFGLIRITSIVGNTTNSRELTFDIKVQN